MENFGSENPEGSIQAVPKHSISQAVQDKKQNLQHTRLEQVHWCDGWEPGEVSQPVADGLVQG